MSEVSLQLKTGWTERQMKEENTLRRLRQIETFLDAEGKASKAKTLSMPTPEVTVQKPRR